MALHITNVILLNRIWTNGSEITRLSHRDIIRRGNVRAAIQSEVMRLRLLYFTMVTEAKTMEY
jgi:hypothetical protein